MKQLFLIGFTTLLFACKPTPNATITGTISNSDAKDFIIENYLLESKDTITIADGKFSDVIRVEKPGYFGAVIGNIRLNLFLEPGDVLNLNLDEEFIKKNGLGSTDIKGSAPTKLYAELSSISLRKEFKKALALPADTFKNIADNEYNIKIQMTDSVKNLGLLNNYSYKLISLLNKIEYTQNYMYFTQYHKRFAPTDTLPIPEGFSQIGNDITIDDSTLFKEVPSYKYFVIGKYEDSIKKELEKAGLEHNSPEYINQSINKIISLNANQAVKDNLGNMILGSYTYQSDSAKTIVKARYKEFVKNEKFIKEFETLLGKLESLQKGKKAPSFSFNDINGKVVNSEDLKGKIIYIDVWATWCGPCKGEIPYLKALEEELHGLDIAFVSISIDNDKKAWENMVADKDLKGYQLFAEKAWESDIVKNYAIRGIPRFILIDKEGNLINADAIRPSNPNTKKRLTSLAKS